ncbi:hypothetical protein HanIR_Chr08g0343221 [Helianthus annuus]|nr:hypothetical protein HanIR_Chr08g0343221 [Helianthus annuus]
MEGIIWEIKTVSFYGLVLDRKILMLDGKSGVILLICKVSVCLVPPRLEFWRFIDEGIDEGIL